MTKASKNQQRKVETARREAAVQERENSIELQRMYLAFIPIPVGGGRESKFVTDLWGSRVLRGSDAHEYSLSVQRERSGVKVSA